MELAENYLVKMKENSFLDDFQTLEYLSSFQKNQ
jgi:hypothetical protein